MLGTHISIESSIVKTFEKAQSESIPVFQIFYGSRISYKRRSIDEQDLKSCKKFDGKLYIHCPYTFSLCKSDIYEKSKEGLITELQVIKLLGKNGGGAIIHPGTAGSKSKQESLDQLIIHLQDLYREKDLGRLILENSSGQGTTIPSTLDEYEYIFKRLDTSLSKKIGVCIDTCHSYAAGLTDWENPKEFRKLFEDKVGMNKLDCFHLNDSKSDFNSHLDRHEILGKGKIWTNGDKVKRFKETFSDIPMITETDHFDQDKLFWNKY